MAVREGAPVVDRLKAVLAKSENVVGRKIAGECLLVPLARQGANLDAIYELNSVAAFVWERIDGHTPGGAIVAALTRHFDVQAERASTDYLELAEGLSSIGAVTIVAEGREPARPASRSGG